MMARIFSEELVDMVLVPDGERVGDLRKISNGGAGEREH